MRFFRVYTKRINHGCFGLIFSTLLLLCSEIHFGSAEVGRMCWPDVNLSFCNADAKRKKLVMFSSKESHVSEFSCAFFLRVDVKRRN